MAKRKTAEKTEPSSATPNKRQRKSVDATASSTRPRRASLADASAPRITRSSNRRASSKAKKGESKSQPPANAKSPVNQTSARKAVIAAKSTKGRKNSAKSAAEEPDRSQRADNNTRISVNVSPTKKPTLGSKAIHDGELEDHDDGPSYWLMKAEPESRLEKGKDVKFSIDDLEAASEPEGWDGVRNPVGKQHVLLAQMARLKQQARNNMRLMMKGDLAFFYHSNCKVPGIVGTMEIVREHSIDETAFDPEHPYYDEKSKRESPKWCLVHVEFRQKFPEMIKLKELQKYAKEGGVLEHMQVLRQSRLSVSKVTKKEWDFIMGLVDMEDIGAASAAHQPKMVE